MGAPEEIALRPVDGVDGVERAIAALWAEAAERGAVLRACKMNLVVVCGGQEPLSRVVEQLGRVTDVQPGRVIVVAPRDPHAPVEPRLDPWIAAHCRPAPGGHLVCSEQVVLSPAGSAEILVPEAVLQLLVEDMPVFAWWRAPLVGDPLLQPVLALADRLIVNTAEESVVAGALGVLDWLARNPAWRGNAGDLAWVRTEPWREMVASFFDPPAARAHLGRLSEIAVASAGPDPGGGSSTGAYLAGWLLSRLGFTVEGPGRARRPDGGPVRIELRGCASAVPGRIESVRLGTEGGEATFEAARTRAEGTGIRLVARGSGLVPRARVLRVQALDDLALLHGELQRDARDTIFESALASAAALLGADGTAA